MQRPDPDAVADRLHSAALHLLRALRRHDAATALTAVQLSALSVVVFAGPVTIGELASAEQVRPATVSRLVDLLERRGLARRHPDPDDGRVVRVIATEEGTRLLAEGRRRRVEALAQRLETLEEDDLATLGRAAAVLESVLRTGDGRGRAGSKEP